MRGSGRSLAAFMAGGILLGSCAVQSAADESKVTEKAAAKAEVETKRWIDQLGSKRFKDREQATRELSQLGKSALPSLKEASKIPDAEVRRRAQQLVERMEPPPVRSIDPNVKQIPAVKSYQ